MFEDRLEALEIRIKILEEQLLELNPKNYKFYSEEESSELLTRLDGVAKSDLMRVCIKLVHLGWENKYGNQRTASALRSKYLRLINK